MLQLTIEEIREYSTYVDGNWPSTDPKYGDPLAYRKPVNGEFYYGKDSRHVVCSGVGPNRHRQLIYAAPAPKYRFVCDDLTPRPAKEGDWVVNNRDARWPNSSDNGYCYGYSFVQPGSTAAEYLIFRREEIPVCPF